MKRSNFLKSLLGIPLIGAVAKKISAKELVNAENAKVGVNQSGYVEISLIDEATGDTRKIWCDSYYGNPDTHPLKNTFDEQELEGTPGWERGKYKKS